MKQYYLERLHWIFNYTSKNIFYCIAKTLLIIIGAPLYLVAFIAEMVLTGVNMLFSWIPVLNVFVMVICKSLIYLLDKTFYVCILTDLKKFKDAMKKEPEYEVEDAVTDSEEFSQDSDSVNVIVESDDDAEVIVGETEN